MDHRDSAAQGRGDGLKPDHDRMILVDDWDDLGEIPARYDVCDTCDGRGTHVNPSIDAHGITAEEFHDDPDFRDDYMRGTFDVQCYGCKGRRIVLVPALPDDHPTAKAILQRLIDHSNYMTECDAERRMGA